MQQQGPPGGPHGYGSPGYGPPGYGPPPQGFGPPPYGPAPPTGQNEAERVTAIDILVPLGLTFVCGIGGFVWGLVRLAQGHKKPGVAAMLVNLGVWGSGIVLWLLALVITAAIGATLVH